MSTDPAVHDAQLEADSWRQTAARWRKRALANGGTWRRRCIRLEEKLDDVNERAADLAEKVVSLEADLVDRPARRDVEELRRQLERSKQEAENERAAAKRLEHRLKEASESSARAANYAARRESEANSAHAKAVDQRQIAENALRVVAVRLDIAWGVEKYRDPRALAAEIDRRLLALVEKAESFDKLVEANRRG